jgi:hypothetical protein
VPGTSEKNERLKEKAVVPVVQGGKVEILPKRLLGKGLADRPVF